MDSARKVRFTVDEESDAKLKALHALALRIQTKVPGRDTAQSTDRFPAAMLPGQ
jgi:hypothetical protein